MDVTNRSDLPSSSPFSLMGDPLAIWPIVSRTGALVSSCFSKERTLISPGLSKSYWNTDNPDVRRLVRKTWALERARRTMDRIRDDSLRLPIFKYMRLLSG
jgi:hypothetical protein